MEYRFAPAGGYEDVASGRVLLHRSGQPPFPARLALELFGRARELAPKKEGLVVYDPFCGGGTLLTVIGFLASAPVALLAGSDLDADALRTAEPKPRAAVAGGAFAPAAAARSAVLRLWETLPPGRRRERGAAGRPPSGSPSAHPGIPGGRLRASLPAGPGAAGGYRRHRHPLRSADALAGGGGRPFARLCGADPGRHGPAGVLALCASAAQALPPFPGWQRLQKQKIGKRRFALYRAD